MTKVDSAWLFLPHTYSPKSVRRFVRLLELDWAVHGVTARLLVAVDGGYEFFRKARLVPDLLIGDFDSLIPFPSRIDSRTLVIPFPRKKEKTDTELAIQYAVKSGAREINLISPEIGEADQFLGIVMGLTSTLIRPRKIRMTILTPTERIWLLRQGSCQIAGKHGDLISVIPLSGSLELSWTGTAYDVKKLRLVRGETVGLRNELRAKTATLTIRGEALVIHRDQLS